MLRRGVLRDRWDRTRDRRADKRIDSSSGTHSGRVAIRLLMVTVVAQSNVAEALLAYERLAAVLREELCVDPSPPTKDLSRSLLELT